jgi:Protein of unknown function (DUF742)
MTRPDDPGAEPPRLVRPYVVTGGRTTARGPELTLDATIRALTDGHELDLTAGPEPRRIVELCAKPVSVAELAARMTLPIGVMRVLVGDLDAIGAVDVVVAPTDTASDPGLLERLLDGIRAL